MFRSLHLWPAILRALRSSQGHARSPWWPRHHTLRCLPLEQLEDRAVPSVIPLNVTSLDDAGDGTLRDAITTADQGSPNDSYVITIETPGTINLKSALPDLSRNITIYGLGASNSTVQRDASLSIPFRIFKVDAGETVHISGLTIARGNAGPGNGGGLDSSGRLTVRYSVFSSNSAGFGGLTNESDGTATLIGCTFTNNSPVVLGPGMGFGGGFENNGRATVIGCTFTSNLFPRGGGGVDNNGTLTVIGSNFTNDSSTEVGGGLSNFGSAVVIGSSFTSNSTIGLGGGIFNGGNLTVIGSILTSNSGSGIYNQIFARATVIGCTFTSNFTAEAGGGLDNNGRATVIGCTFTSNTASSGNGGLNNETGGMLTQIGNTFTNDQPPDFFPG